jgi:lipopolysaccharide export LptBFGC system permease protein LptF
MRPMSIFEAIMLLCFGLAWPFSIWKSWKSRQNGGKSVWFLLVVFVGYVAGVIHKLLYSMDPVIALYALNGVMVALDVALYYRNAALSRVGAR